MARSPWRALAPLVLAAAGCAAPASGGGGGGAGGGDARAVGSGGGAAIPREVVDLLRGTARGYECVVEFDEAGGLVSVEAGIPIASVPREIRDAADRHVPGGTAVAAMREWAGGALHWGVVKEIDGVRHEILIRADGSLAGLEAALRVEEVPDGLVEAARRAVDGGDLVVAARVTGFEAVDGEAFHVKVRLAGEVLRVGLREDGTVVRVVRRSGAEVRVPR